MEPEHAHTPSSPVAAQKQKETTGKQPQEPVQEVSAAPSLLQKVLAEFVATYVMVFSGCGAVMVNTITDGELGIVGIAAVWGVVVTAMIYTSSHISGTHMNPAVTLSFAACHGFPWRQVPWYMTGQVLGSTAAAVTLRLVFHTGTPLDRIVTRPLKNDYLQSFVLEIIITFILLFVVSGTATDTHSIGILAGLVIGAVVAMNVLVAGPVSGASMNPARSLGPAIATNSFKEVYVYLLAPVVGAMIGCLLYNQLRAKKKTEQGPENKIVPRLKLLLQSLVHRVRNEP